MLLILNNICRIRHDLSYKYENNCLNLIDKHYFLYGILHKIKLEGKKLDKNENGFDKVVLDWLSNVWFRYLLDIVSTLNIEARYPA